MAARFLLTEKSKRPGALTYRLPIFNLHYKLRIKPSYNISMSVQQHEKLTIMGRG